MTRPSGRAHDALRSISLEAGFSLHAEGSCLVRCGNTHVLCTASVDERVPPFLRNSGKGWVTAEYGMLPRSTHTRSDREAARGKQGGRTLEIQRLIGRSLRAVTDLKSLGERQIKIDCDVIQADGGTRTASITGAWVALKIACEKLLLAGAITRQPIIDNVAAISCGVYKGTPVLDLDYDEDSNAEIDANFVMSANGGLVEIQATG
ncbi:MAG: ribonuclease PH, partial [Candidatus Puniceispirillum sp.]